MSKKHPPRCRIQPYVLRELAQRIAKHAATHGTTDSAVVEAAVKQYLDGTSDKTLLFRRLDRLGRAVARIQRDMELLTEAFAIWVRLWFAHTPSIPEDAKRGARALAESRYRQFVEHVADQFGKGARFIDDLPHESIADDAELLEAAKSETDQETTK